MYYNFVRIHQTLKVSPAMAAGVTDKLWEVSDIVVMVEQWELANFKPDISSSSAGKLIQSSVSTRRSMRWNGSRTSRKLGCCRLSANFNFKIAFG